MRFVLGCLLTLGLAAPAVANAQHDGVSLGGAVRFQYAYRDWLSDSRERRGDVEFDLFRLNADGRHGALSFSAEYRWYEYMDVIHHAWIGYELSPHWQVQLGVHQVPFGLLPVASHNFFFSSNFYIGLEDDYDAGIKVLYRRDPWHLVLAFYKNEEWGNGAASERYSYDVIAGGEQQNEETNQLNLRLERTVLGPDGVKAELGVSAQYGELYNRITSRSGSRSAAAMHLSLDYRRWNLQLQSARYRYSPKNPGGVDNSVVQVGAYGALDFIPATASSLIANVAYALPVRWGPVSEIQLYNDHSVIFGKSGDASPTRMNVLGMRITAGKTFTYVDLVQARNQPSIGGSVAGRDSGWNTRFNVNVGYYF